jgi:hypothetical protein
MNESELDIVKRILENVTTKLKDFGRCYEGEINLTFHKKFLSSKDSFAQLIKGAAIQKYQILSEMSQGEIQYLNAEAFLKNNTSPKSRHHKVRRIVMQGITGVNEAVRLKMTIIDKGIYCGNSANYILLEDSRVHEKYLLGLLNSSLMNWYFKLFSTNSNVNGYQVDVLPLKISENPEQERIVETLVDYVLYLKSLNQPSDMVISSEQRLMSAYFEQLIDSLVYELYFPNEFQDTNKSPLSMLTQAQLPSFNELKDDRYSEIRGHFRKLFATDHPVRSMIFFIDSIETVRVIEAKLKR